MKKWLSLLLVFATAAALLARCSSKKDMAALLENKIWNKGVAPIDRVRVIKAPFKRAMLIAHTTDKQLEAGVAVCYVDERGDTIIPYGKYTFCQTDTIRKIGFAYENKPDARIVCLNNEWKELFYVFRYDNGPDYIREGLFRITDDEGRIGFADTLGHVVIKPQYLYATPFINGKAQVTTSGKWKKDGEHSSWQSDEWQFIDHSGHTNSCRADAPSCRGGCTAALGLNFDNLRTCGYSFMIYCIYTEAY